jgi:hypothetical protein
LFDAQSLMKSKELISRFRQAMENVNKVADIGLPAGREPSPPACAAKNFVKELFLGRGLASRAQADSLGFGSLNICGLIAYKVLLQSQSLFDSGPFCLQTQPQFFLLWPHLKWRIFRIHWCQGLGFWAVHSSVASSTI